MLRAYSSSRLALVLMAFAFMLLISAGVARASDPIPAIESAMREYQARHLYVTGKTVPWPSCCGASATPPFPPDNYYDDVLKNNTKLAIRLVGALHWAMHASVSLPNGTVIKETIWQGFLKESPDGKLISDWLWYREEDLPSSAFAAINADNFQEVFSALRADIAKLKRMSIGGATFVPQLMGFGFVERVPGVSLQDADANAKAAIELSYPQSIGPVPGGSSIGASESVAVCFHDEALPNCALEPGSTPPHFALRVYSATSARPRIDLTGWPEGDPVVVYLAVEKDGVPVAPAPPVSGDPPGQVKWHSFFSATTGSVVERPEVATVPGTPTWSLPTPSPAPSQGGCIRCGSLGGSWRIIESIGVLTPDFDTSPNLGRCGEGSGSCSTCTPGKATMALGSGGVDAAWSLGPTSSGDAAGILQIRGANLEKSMATVSRLVTNAGNGSIGSGVIADGLHHVHASDIVPPPAGSLSAMRLRFYDPSIPGIPSNDNDPHVRSVAVIRYSETGSGPGLTKRLRIEQTGAESGLWEYTQTSSGFTLESGNQGEPSFERTTLAVAQMGSGQTSHTRAWYRAGEPLPDFREVEVRQQLPWGEEVVAIGRGAAGQELWEQRTFDTTEFLNGNPNTPNPNYAKLLRTVDHLGRWKQYSYDQFGRVVGVMEPHLSGQWTAGPQQNRLTTFTYHQAPNLKVLETVLYLRGTAIAQSYGAEFLETNADIPFVGNSLAVTEVVNVRFTTPNPNRNAIAYVTALRSSNWRVGDDEVLVMWREGTHRLRPIMTRTSDGSSVIRLMPGGSTGTTTTYSLQMSEDWNTILSGQKTERVVDAGGVAYRTTAFDYFPSTQTWRRASSTWSSLDDVDALKRPLVERIDDDGDNVADGVETKIYSCCGLATEVDRHGVTKTYKYDPMKRLIEVRTAVSPSETMAKLLRYTADGQVLTESLQSSNGNIRVIAQNAYDAAGRRVATSNAESVSTQFMESSANGIITRIELTADPDGPSNPGLPIAYRRTYHLDGSPATEGGTHSTAAAPGLSNKAFTSGVASPSAGAGALPFVQQGLNNGEIETTTTYMDGLGRNVRVVYADGAFSRTIYSNRGVLQQDPDGVQNISVRGHGQAELTHPLLVGQIPGVDLDGWEWSVTGLDMNRDGKLTFAGTDRMELTRTTIGPASVLVFPAGQDQPVRITENRVFKENGSGNTVVVGRSETTLDGKRSAQQQFNKVTTTRTELGPKAGEVRTIVQDPAGDTTTSLSLFGRATSSERRSSDERFLGRQETSYDQWGQVSQTAFVRDPNDRTMDDITDFTYDVMDRVVSTTLPDPRSGTEPRRISTNAYDLLGRLVQVTHDRLDGPQTLYSYLPTGQVYSQVGFGVNPVINVYDAAGRLVELHTYKQAWNEAGKAITRWVYNSNRGWLDRKVYHDGKATDYTYTPGGRLASRLWARSIDLNTPHARRVTTTYVYNALSGMLTGVNYNDRVTMPLAFAYTRDGQLRQVTDAAGKRDITYRSDGQVLNESIASAGLLVSGSPPDLLVGVATARSYSSDNMAWESASLNGQEITRADFEYDSYDRIERVSKSGAAANYTYDLFTGQIVSRTYQRLVGSNWENKIVGSHGFDRHGRLVDTHWRRGSSTGNLFYGESFGYDVHGRRTSKFVDLKDPMDQQWQYQYDALNQLTQASATFTSVPPTPVGGSFASYSYDQIGNRTSVAYGDDATTTYAATYDANALNQVTRRDVPGFVEVSGHTNASAVIAIANGQPTGSDYADVYYEYFHKRLNVSSNTMTVDHDIAVQHVPGPASTYRVLLPVGEETLVYDKDGNLISDQLWTYEWDAENRLSAMQLKPGLAFIDGMTTFPHQTLRIEYAYDYMSRRILKRVLHGMDPTSGFGDEFFGDMLLRDAGGGAIQWSKQYDHRYVYTGPGSWNLAAVLQTRQQSLLWITTTKQTFAWGPDLSGTLQGAGGIGGLAIYVEDDRDTPGNPGYVGSAGIIGPMFPTYDGNGNVMGVYDATPLSAGGPQVRASYRYGPFGESRGQDGLLNTAFPFRWSTKFTDNETGLSYYGYRYYSASLGRWISRDPIEELGGLTLYGFNHNNPMGFVDPDGRLPIVLIPIGIGAAAMKAAAALFGISVTACLATPACREKAAELAKQAMDELIDSIGTIVRRIDRLCDEKPSKCLPCIPVVGSIAYRVDMPPSKPHNGIPTPHSHKYRMHQRPPSAGCKCFWREELKHPLPGVLHPAISPAAGGGIAPR